MPRREVKPGGREDRIEVRLTKGDRAKIEQLAREANLKLSEWVRARLMLDQPIGRVT